MEIQIKHNSDRLTVGSILVGIPFRQYAGIGKDFQYHSLYMKVYFPDSSIVRDKYVVDLKTGNCVNIPDDVEVKEVNAYIVEER